MNKLCAVYGHRIEVLRLLPYKFQNAYHDLILCI